MRLMLRDVEMAHAEREIDGIEIFEGCGEIRQVERQHRHREDRSQAGGSGHAGRSRRPSLRLPVR